MSLITNFSLASLLTRNTKEIVKHLNSIIPSEMIGFEKSPAGQPVLFKESSSPKEEAEMIRNDLASFFKEGVAPGEIVILINKPLADSAVSLLQKIGRYPVEWMGRTYRPDASKIQVTDIRNFKGLEANVLLITGLDERQSREAPEWLYTQVSRARLLLTIYYSASRI